ncbi:MAG: hypothetical protein ABI068_04200 [Ktedonobacterales bacterium]
MSNKYQREIEEILRNMEGSGSSAEPRRGADTPLDDRITAFRRTSTRARVRRPRLPILQISVAEWLFLLSIVLALAAAGLAYYENGATVVSGAVALAAFVIFVLALILSWRDRFRPRTTPSWQGNATFRDEMNRITANRPLRRNPFSELATQLRILRLKLRYRSSHRDE